MRRLLPALVLALTTAACVIPPPQNGYNAAPQPDPNQQQQYSEQQPAPQPQPVYGAVAQSECKSAYGTTACGYGCVAGYGVVRCASQPGGTCQAAYGQVTCYDPPAAQGAYQQNPGYAAPAPASECKSAYGTTACGYGCVAEYGQVRCASQPGGMCQAASGQITCTN